MINEFLAVYAAVVPLHALIDWNIIIDDKDDDEEYMQFYRY